VRDAFFDVLAELGVEDERVWALTGDLGIGLFDAFEAAAPGRYLNVGIAEQNLVGIAAGLAYAGKVAFAYSIAPFLASRAHDQVRVDVALGRANVKLVGVGGGLAYGTLGPTHHAIEDVALMRALPHMTVLAPGDPVEARGAARAAAALDGPVYLRLGKNGEPRLLPDEPFVVGAARWVRDGRDVTLATSGPILGEALGAAEVLAAEGVDVGVLHFPTLKPFATDAVVEALERTPRLVTVEEHSVIGGLGSAVAEAIAESGVAGRLRRVGLPDTFAHAVGSRDYLLGHYGLDAAAIATAARELLAERSLA
jgi:transketolase